MIVICPNCNKRSAVSELVTDFVCNCNEGGDNRANTQQDIAVMGPWEDYTGSDPNAKTNFYRGVANKLQGTRAGVEGASTQDLTRRGNPKQVYRTRDYLQYFEVNKK